MIKRIAAIFFSLTLIIQPAAAQTEATTTPESIPDTVRIAVPADEQEAEPVVIGRRLTLYSEILGEDREILIGLPEDYTQSGEHYPVLYLLDGSFHFHHVTGLTRFLAAVDRAPGMIVVGIVNTDRNRDLTPPAAVDSTQLRLPFSNDSFTFRYSIDFPTAGGADAFLSFITDELAPFVEEDYRVAPFRILAGHSFGGLLVTHALLTQPGSFHGYIASDPSLWWNNGAVAASAAERLEGLSMTGRFYFGSMADLSEMIPLLAQLTEAFELYRPDGFRWWHRILTNESHTTVSHRSFEEGLVAVFADWPVSEALIFSGNVAAIEDHFAGLSNIYEYELRAPEGLLNQMGYLQLQIGRGERAVEIFRRNIELYPASANVYDSLADAMEEAGEFDEALRNREEAVRLAEETGDERLEVFLRKRDELLKQEE